MCKRAKTFVGDCSFYTNDESSVPASVLSPCPFVDCRPDSAMPGSFFGL